MTGTECCLHLLEKLLTEFGTSASTTQLLKDCTVYVLPRVSADGAEIYLTTADTMRAAPVLFPETTPPPGQP